MGVLENIGKALRGGNGQETTALADMREYLRETFSNAELLQERLAELELSLEDKMWITLGGADREFDRRQLGEIWKLCRLMYLKNPLINRGVNIQSYYVWGQGVNIQAKAEPLNEVIQTFMDDPLNQTELTSHQARTLKETDLQVYGNLFLVLFADRVTGEVRIRSIPVEEITDIISNPEDRRDIWYYKREWTQSAIDWGTGIPGQKQEVAYYPDWRYRPASQRQDSIGEKPIMWDAAVYHIKVGGLGDMKFGIPEIYQALDWAKAYKSFLEDWATIVRAYARFAWQLKGPGSATAVTAAKAKLGTTLATGSETNPPPTAGSTFIGKEGYSMEPIRTAGATTTAEDGRRLLLMVCAAMGLPESFFGDVSVGTLATAKSLDRPTELKFEDRRTLWADVLHDIFDYVIEAAYAASQSSLPDIDPDTGEDIDRHIYITFPSILEHDIESSVKSIVSAATLDGKPAAGTIPDIKMLSSMLLAALGVEDVDEILENLFPEDAEPEAEAFTEALRELRQAIGNIVNDNGH